MECVMILSAKIHGMKNVCADGRVLFVDFGWLVGDCSALINLCGYIVFGIGLILKLIEIG